MPQLGLILLLAVSVSLFSARTLAAAVELVDATDTLVKLDQPAQRVISLAPHITESVFAVGGGEQLVGVVRFSDYPEAAQDIEEVGTYKQVNLEQIVALKPDLILSFGSGNGWDMINRLRALGLKVFVSEPRSLEDIATDLNHYGQLLGHSIQGTAAAEKYLTDLSQLRDTYQQRSQVGVFYQVWDDPLLTINGSHVISDVIQLCGARNIFADAVPLVPTINLEALIEADPEVIIASGMGEERPEWLDAWRRWDGLQAVREEHLYVIPPDLIQRHTPRILVGAKKLCEFVQRARE